MAQTGIETQLLNETLKHLDLKDYCLVTADTTVRQTVERMRNIKTHCTFVVGERTKLAGIVTERDILKKVVGNPDIWEQPVTEIMTPTPKTLMPDASAHDALKLMDDNHFRNVPVIDGEIIVGNITHFSVLAYLVDHVAEAVYNLPPDPENYANQQYGG